MRLVAARIQKYRSIRDTGLFEIDKGKTILVGPNEAGKTAVLQALQQINAPEGVSGFDALRDYPRSEYNDITTGAVDSSKITVAEAHFALEPDDIAALPPGYDDARYHYGRHLDNSAWHDIDGGPERERYSVELKKQLDRMAAHVDKAPLDEGQAKPSARLAEVTAGWLIGFFLPPGGAASLKAWLNEIPTKTDKNDSTEKNRHTKLLQITEKPEAR